METEKLSEWIVSKDVTYATLAKAADSVIKTAGMPLVITFSRSKSITYDIVVLFNGTAHAALMFETRVLPKDGVAFTVRRNFKAPPYIYLQRGRWPANAETDVWAEKNFKVTGWVSFGNQVPRSERRWYSGMMKEFLLAIGSNKSSQDAVVNILNSEAKLAKFLLGTVGERIAKGDRSFDVEVEFSDEEDDEEAEDGDDDKDGDYDPQESEEYDL